MPMFEIPPTFGRRELLAASAALGAAFLTGPNRSPAEQPGTPKNEARKRDRMKKSMNQWAFPDPDKMNLEQCLRLAKEAGFDGIELNYDLDNDLSPKSGTKEYEAIRKKAAEIGIAISGVCSFLFWPF